MGMFDGADDELGGPQLTDDQKMAIAMLGQMPEMYDSPGGGMAPGSGRGPVMPQPVIQPSPSAPPMQPAPLTPAPTGAAPAIKPAPMGPPDESAYPVQPNLAAGSTPGAVPPVLPGAPTIAPSYKSPFTPPPVDMAARDKLVAARDATRGAAPQAKLGWKDYLRAAITAAAAGYGRDPQAISRGMEAGAGVLGQPQERADADQTRKNQIADRQLADFDERSGIQRTQFEDTLKGEIEEGLRLTGIRVVLDVGDGSVEGREAARISPIGEAEILRLVDAVEGAATA